MISNTQVGKRLPRLDALGKVTGKVVYGSDFALPGMLYGKLLRSQYPHARLIRIDGSQARQLPGVRAVITAADAPRVRFGGAVRDETVFATDCVRYLGEPVAAVAADSTEIAEQALAHIHVEYERLPAVFDAEGAMQPEAVLIHPEWATYTTHPISIVRGGNVASRSFIHKGNVDQAFSEANYVFEDRFETQIQHQGYMEPRAAVADVDASGRVTVWTNTQLPFAIQTTLGEILELPVGKLRVVLAAIGGGFGGKLRLGMEPYAVLLAQQTGRPVKVMTTVEEELIAAYPRQPAILYLKTGVRRDGTIIAKEGRIIFEAGAFAGASPTIASVGTLVLAGPYKIPNLRIEGCAVYTNRMNFGAFRAPSGPQSAFAAESQMDIIAEKLGIDPLELRLKNIVGEGDLGPTGSVLRGVGLREALEKVAEAIEWKQPVGDNEGKGIACSWWTVTGGSSGVYVKLNTDGSVVLMSGAAEIGTGALTSGAAQVLADTLGVRMEDVEVVFPDTSMTPYDFGAQGSRTVFSVGNAARVAAEDIKRQLILLATRELDASPETLAVSDRSVFVQAEPERRLTFAQCAQISNQRGGGIIAHGTFVAPTTEYDRSTVTNHFYPAFHSPSFHAHAAHVKVDPGTGEVTIKRYVVAQDVGFAINPTFVEGQIEGGVTQGIGQALFEEVAMQEGRVLNPNLTDYKMPTMMDVPRVESIIVQHPSSVGPYGAKGVGEAPAIEPPAAIANAIARAVGIRIKSLPITAEKVLLAIRGNRTLSK
jgi:CO/xanthine dehydrogenase Mo-binding subunit